MKNITSALSISALTLCLTTAAMPAAAQPPGPGNAQPAREVAPVDLSGYWVSLVTEDWRFRMVTASAGDYQGIPLNQAGREIADAWDPAAAEAAGEECMAYGVGGIMRMPTRLNISWSGANVLRIDTDAGQQSRRLKFGPAQDDEGAGSLQGVSRAHWELERAGGFGSPVVNGSLMVETARMSPGYFRRNGVPYSGNATVTEYFELLPHEDGDYLTVISVLEDPTYLNDPVITSSNFKREPDDEGWNPRPCMAR